MKRNFKLGLILGIAILMLLPVYARAQMSLSNLQGVTVATITATQGDTISFTVTSPSSSPISMITSPEPNVSTQILNFAKPYIVDKAVGFGTPGRHFYVAPALG